MKTLFKFFILAACLCLIANPTFGQEADEAQTYHVHDYLQVAPGNHADYLAVEKVWKKIHQANIKAGNYLYWELTEIVMPVGSSTEYNYVTRIAVRGEENLAALMTGEFFSGNLTENLTDAEKALFQRTGELRTYVKKEVYTVSHILPAEDFKDVKVSVMNHFDYPEGSGHQAHVQMEKDIWAPVHAARIKAGEMLGWVVANKIMPGGAGESFHDVTVDLYKDMPTYLANRSPMPQFNKVHADKSIDNLMAKTDAAASLVYTEVRHTLDASNL